MAKHLLREWETSERLLESGGFESRQRVLVAEPAVEASDSGARWLGVTYWQAVAASTRGVVRATWSADGGRLKLLGGANLLTFGSPAIARRRRHGLVPVSDPGRDPRVAAGRLGHARAASRRW